MTVAKRLYLSLFCFHPLFCPSLSSVGVGVILGGAIMHFFKNPQTKAKRMALLLCVVSGLALPFILGYLIHCPSIDVVGIG